MGKRIKSLMDAANAAGYAMAAEDIYAEDEVAAKHVMAPARTSALVPYVAATPSVSLVEQARSQVRLLAQRYGGTAWLAPRLPA